MSPGPASTPQPRACSSPSFSGVGLCFFFFSFLFFFFFFSVTSFWWSWHAMPTDESKCKDETTPPFLSSSSFYFSYGLLSSRLLLSLDLVLAYGFLIKPLKLLFRALF